MGLNCKYMRRPSCPEITSATQKRERDWGASSLRCASPFGRAALDALRRTVGQACCLELSKCGTASNSTNEREGKKDQLHDGVSGVQATMIPATAATWL